MGYGVLREALAMLSGESGDSFIKPRELAGSLLQALVWVPPW